MSFISWANFFLLVTTFYLFYFHVQDLAIGDYDVQYNVKNIFLLGCNCGKVLHINDFCYLRNVLSKINIHKNYLWLRIAITLLLLPYSKLTAQDQEQICE